ncbi:thiol-disulfide oxidoreductase DCC family protein [Haladaptatus caseinilyticus]|uniref:thiol-disulfide oxidoreductase DCC family protein n=1 Tax=Haladaptatus caseinilyticus TaxID=2993314 RepID=UPI00224B567D|nr:thiol-disulfide oxidoreductase DCC family protein [Haladaptatus caseinilyticus]
MTADDPDPADTLDTPVLLFDGVCNLCNAIVRFTVRFDESGTFRFAPLQSEIGQELLSRFDLPTDDFDSFVLVEGDDYATRSTAALRVCRRLDGPWPLLYPFVYLPERLRDPVYDFVARHRYRVFGRKAECPVPDPEIRERFAERALDTS